jgi:hypothetical protein
MKSFTAAISLAALVSTVAGHGSFTSPAPRKAGQAMAKTCGQQMYNNQAADAYGNIQGEMQVAKGQSDFDAAACQVWLCKGFKFEDNSDNVQTYTAGQTIDMKFEVRAPHTGTANVSIVDTATGSVIGSPLISWDVFASNSVPNQADQASFSVTIPKDLGDKCSTAGNCVIQHFWDARSIDQTYESCIDFTVSGSGSGSGPSKPSKPSSSPTPSSSTAPVVTSAPVVTPAASATPTVTLPIGSIPSATSSPASGSSGSLPETFTLDTFISWLKETAGSSSSKARRSRAHARAF